MAEPNAWRRCNTCKAEIPFGGAYFACSVSTCNRRATDFAFCSLSCWDAHVPLFRHRDAWAEERRAPTREAFEEERRRAETEAVERKERARQARAGTPREPPRPGVATGAAAEREILVVASRLKAYVRARSGMNTSDAVLEVLSDRLRALCDQAIDRAGQAGRKTVLDRDF